MVVELVVVMSGRVVVVDVLVTSGRVVVVLDVAVPPLSGLVVVVDELGGGSVGSVEEIDDEEVEILIVVVVTSEPLRFPHTRSPGLLAIPKVACNPVVSTLATPDTLVELLTYEPQKVLTAERTIVQVDPAANETPDTVTTLEPRVGAATHVVETRV